MADDTLAAFSFPDEYRATEFVTAAQRLANEGHLVVSDAVFVVKDAEGHTYVRETADLAPADTALGAGLWSGLFGLILGGPVGLLVGGAIGAGAGALTAAAVDLGVSDATIAQLREAVQPGTTTVVLLVSHVDQDAVLAELRRFEGARYVWGDLPAAGIAAVQAALGEHNPDGT